MGKNECVCVKKLFFFLRARKKKTDFSNECVCPRKLCQEKKTEKKTLFEKKKTSRKLHSSRWKLQRPLKTTRPCQYFCQSKQIAKSVQNFAVYLNSTAEISWLVNIPSKKFPLLFFFSTTGKKKHFFQNRVCVLPIIFSWEKKHHLWLPILFTWFNKGPSTYYVILFAVKRFKRITFFLVNRVEHQKLNQTTAELSFGWVFGVQLGLRQTQ